jgi:hypothetical protein
VKLSKNAEKCILIGYDGDEGYRLLSETGKLIRSKDVIFNETVLTPCGPGDYEEPHSVEIYFPLSEPPMFDARGDERT